MKYEYDNDDTLPCELEIFKINGKEADIEDFVCVYDHTPDIAEPYGCGDMRADIISPTKEVLNKYNISLNEFYEIANDLAETLSIGSCEWCL